jgi:hypothetical protein
VPDRPGEGRTGQPAHADGRSEQAQRAGIAAEPFGVDRGKRATGRPKTVALRSARNAPASTWLRRMKLIPSATARGPGRGALPCGRMAGSLATVYRAAAKLTASRR